MPTGTNGSLRLLGAVCCLTLLLVQPAHADPFASGNIASISSLVVLICVLEPLVIMFEARYMNRVLKIHARTASVWSLTANLVSLILGSFLLFAVLLVETFGGHPLGMLVVIALSYLVAIGLEYPTLRVLSRQQLPRRELLRCCIRMNAISVPSLYVVQYLVFWFFAWIGQPAV